MPTTAPRRQSAIASVIDSIWFAVRYLLDAATFVSIRIYGIDDFAFRHVRSGSYDNVDYQPRNLDRAKDLDAILSETKESLAIANDRRTAVTDKCKTLLTLSSFLLAVIGALLPKTFDFSSTWMRVVCFVAIAFLLNTVVLLLVYFGLGTETVPSISQDEIELDSDNLKKSLINEHYKSEVATENRTDYLADIYKVSRACFILAFFIIVALFAVSYFAPGESESQRLIREIRSNPDLIRLLQGPKGDKGDAGINVAIPVPSAVGPGATAVALPTTSLAQSAATSPSTPRSAPPPNNATQPSVKTHSTTSPVHP